MNQTSATPAVCAIDDCGVIAIGRCATCKRAFCRSHQGYGRDNFMQPVPYLDLCAPCAAERQAAAARQAEEAQAPFMYFVSGAARTDLLNSGVPSVSLYTVREVWEPKRGFFGRGGEYVKVATPCGRGWILGMFKWKYNRNRSGTGESVDVVGECLTALVDKTPDNWNHGLTYVQPCEGGFEDMNSGRNDQFQGEWTSESGWREAMQAVKQLIGESS